MIMSRITTSIRSISFYEPFDRFLPAGGGNDFISQIFKDRTKGFEEIGFVIHNEQASGTR
jgi:hypothetical protein